MKNRVLIVDDNEIMQSFLQHIVGSSFHVQTAYNAEEALFFLSQTPEMPRIVLIDFDLEGMNGLEMLVKMKAHAQYKHIAVIILSGKKEHKVACLDAGAASYIVKPFIPADLQRTLIELTKAGHLKKTG